MFDIGWGELVVIGVVALIAIGPKELPGVLRTTGLWMGKIRRMANEFQDQFREAMREAEMDDLKKKVDEMSASNFTNFDPIGTVRKEFENLVSDPLQKVTASDPSAPTTPSAPAETGDVASSIEPSPTTSAVQTEAAPEPPTVRKGGEGA